MRQLYITSIRPIITNACPVWFITGDDSSQCHNVNQELVCRLDSLQCLCLRAIAGTFKSASRPQIQKELHIQPIAIHLQRLTSCHRARNIFTQDVELLDNRYFPKKQTLKFLKSHPYRILYDRARGLVDAAEEHLRQSNGELRNVPFDDMDPHRRSGFITSHIRSQAELHAEHVWRTHRDGDGKRKHAPNAVCGRPVAAQGEWGKANLKRYKGLSRAQSTILLQCRTRFIGLNTFLRPRTLADTSMCDCGKGEHTVEHLIFDCEQLENARRNLPLRQWKFSRYNTPMSQLRSLDCLLTDHADTVSTWALNHFGLAQFDWTDQNMISGPSLKHPCPLSEGV
ncbi:hypothetical protein CPLU01_14277 [Colletotrichum plurivorum]|uniref:Reverse transcriptase n=1 Tax=Colletotrichum plurivorum TaxID=2175906 RepID=A0A8H6JKI3_9PEZI|nr:hypothetical protein CPLU01_14277 [Colletotrichum plurivorum]